MHGRGVFEWTNGFRYEGELRDGKQHGYGVYVGTSGERYRASGARADRTGRVPTSMPTASFTRERGATAASESATAAWASIGTSAAACGFE